MNIKMKKTKLLVILIGLLALSASAAPAAAQEKTAGPYKVKFETNPTTVVAGTRSSLVVTFLDAQAGALMVHLDLSIKISRGNAVVFVSDNLHTHTGLFGVSVLFPDAGAYQVAIDFQSIHGDMAKQGDLIVIARGPLSKETLNFNLEVAAQPTSLTFLQSPLTLALAVGTLVVGAGAGYATGRRKREQKD